MRIVQGGFHVTDSPDDVLTTVLGSCVAVCMRNPHTGFGGMNHFLLPSDVSPKRDGYHLRYGTYSIERLINAILSRGGDRGQLEVKVFGGANILQGMTEIGTRNAEFVETYLKKEGVTVAARDLGGRFARRIRYFPTIGRVLMGRMTTQLSTIGRREIELLDTDLLDPTAGKAEIFRPVQGESAGHRRPGGV